MGHPKKITTLNVRVCCLDCRLFFFVVGKLCFDYDRKKRSFCRLITVQVYFVYMAPSAVAVVGEWNP